MWEPLTCSGTNWRRLRFDMEATTVCTNTHPPTNDKNNDLILSKKEVVYNRDRHVPLLYFFLQKKVQIHFKAEPVSQGMPSGANRFLPNQVRLTETNKNFCDKLLWWFTKFIVFCFFKKEFRLVELVFQALQATTSFLECQTTCRGSTFVQSVKVKMQQI